MRALTLLAGALVAFAASLPTLGFESFPPGGNAHDTITARAARRAGLSRSAVRWLQAAVRRPDLEQMSVDLTLLGGRRMLRAFRTEQLWMPGCRYDRLDHFDRAAGEPSAVAFAAARDRMLDARDRAVERLSVQDVEEAIRALGDALHALQDFFSHSNAVDLDAERRAELLQILYARGVAAPPQAKLALGIVEACPPPRGLGEPARTLAEAVELCDAGSESHLCLNKDSDTSVQGRLKSNGRSKYAAARDLATEHSAILLEQVRRRVAKSDWVLLQQARLP